MRRVLYVCSIILFSLLFFACEEVIDVDLNESEPRLVIEAQLSDLSSSQRIRVSKTVAFTAEIGSEPVENAVVLVQDEKGQIFPFNYSRDGNYVNNDFLPVSGRSYTLNVNFQGEKYQANCFMPHYVEVDSIGVIEERLFGEPYYFATFKFSDIQGQRDYFKYDLSVNQSEFRFTSVFSDKFNDGLFVTHQVADSDRDFVPGDTITVRRYCVDPAVFKYWNEFQSTNPGTAAPGNPTSNISNDALGCFSVASCREYGLRVSDFQETVERNTNGSQLMLTTSRK